MFKEILASTGLTQTKELKSQGHYYDDKRSFAIRPLEMKSTHFLEKKDGVPIAGYWHQFKNEYYFEGYQGIPPGYITPSFPRDIVLQHHDVYEDIELPRMENGQLVGAAIQEVGLTVMHQINTEVKIASQSNKIINTLIGVIILLALAIALKALL